MKCLMCVYMKKIRTYENKRHLKYKIMCFEIEGTFWNDCFHKNLVTHQPSILVCTALAVIKH